jgi:hypothetical protein
LLICLVSCYLPAAAEGVGWVGVDSERGIASMVVLLSVNGGLEKLGNHWEIITALVI